MKLPTPKTPLYTQKLCRYLVHKWSYAYSNVWLIFTIAVIVFVDFFAKNSGNCFNILIISQIGTRIHGSTSDERLTTFLPWTMRCRQGISWNFGWFLSKFGCHGNYLGSLKISDSIFKFTDPENLTIRVKKSLILCPELKSVHFLLIFGQIWLPIRKNNDKAVSSQSINGQCKEDTKFPFIGELPIFGYPSCVRLPRRRGSPGAFIRPVGRSTWIGYTQKINKQYTNIQKNKKTINQ